MLVLNQTKSRDMDIDFEKSGGLVPAIIQDADTKTVLMLGYMNKEAYEKTVATGLVTFYSRSRKCLWTKGETSNNFLRLVDIKVDCDNDTLLVKVHPDGPTCHKGTDTCVLRVLVLREGCYTCRLLGDGLNRMAQKVGEEALELVIEATNGTNDRLIYEGSDMLYHLIVLLTHKGLRIEDMAAELRERHCPGWKKH